MSLRWRVVDQNPQAALFPEEQLVERHVGHGEFRGLEFFHVHAKRIVNRVPAASRMPFSCTINPYRGCSHACTYCFARPSHAYLDLGIGHDFDTKIVVKCNTVEQARAELDPRRWTGERIALGTNTDPYQRCEGKYHLTQGLIDVFVECGVGFSILTKSTLIVRDLDRLVEASKRVPVRVNLSIATLDADVWRATEPGTPHPLRRVEAVARLNDAGIPCGVLMAPIIPGLSDQPMRLRATIRACLDAGAVSIGASPLYLRDGVRLHFLEALARSHPELAEEMAVRYPVERPYLPAAEARLLSATVDTIVAELGGPRHTQVVPSHGDVHDRTRQLGLGEGRLQITDHNNSNRPNQLSLLDA